MVKFLSNDLVYLLLGVTTVFIIFYSRKHWQRAFNSSIYQLVKSWVFLIALPVGLATLISEVISQIYVKARPFAEMPNVKLLVPHGADGGMPSHHMVFMTALTLIIYRLQRDLGLLFLGITLLSGFARISAGIHYPSDVLVGIFLGWLVSYLYLRLVGRFNLFRYLIRVQN